MRAGLLKAGHRIAFACCLTHYKRTHGSQEEKGKFGTWVRFIHHSLQATWRRNHFIRKQPYSVHIRKGSRAARYPESAFAKANEWGEF